MNWWRKHTEVLFKVNDADKLEMGRASGHECNCLIDTLRQQLGLDCDIGAVREYVQAQHGSLVRGDFLELQAHWRSVIKGFAELMDDDFLTPLTYQIVCVDATFIGNGDVEGVGAQILYIARQNANHFVPLIRAEILEESEPEFCGSSSASEEVHPVDDCSADETDSAKARTEAAKA
mgnify:CR=1 FL=1